MEKICTKCQTEKKLEEFAKHKRYTSGYGPRCKQCVKEYSQQRYITHSHVWKKWNDENQDKVRQSSRKWVENNSEKFKIYQKNYIKNWSKDQYQNNLEYKLQKVLRSRLYTAIKKEYKNTSAVDLIGCSIQELIEHLEQQFTSEMSWENYGVYWEIDHIKQVNIFNFKNNTEQQECFNYNNLRPLEKIENRKRPKK
jgi:uncharacterized membrane protein YheB (UPF0754 family)